MLFSEKYACRVNEEKSNDELQLIYAARLSNIDRLLPSKSEFKIYRQKKYDGF